MMIKVFLNGGEPVHEANWDQRLTSLVGIELASDTEPRVECVATDSTRVQVVTWSFTVENPGELVEKAAVAESTRDAFSTEAFDVSQSEPYTSVEARETFDADDTSPDQTLAMSVEAEVDLLSTTGLPVYLAQKALDLGAVDIGPSTYGSCENGVNVLAPAVTQENCDALATVYLPEQDGVEWSQVPEGTDPGVYKLTATPTDGSFPIGQTVYTLEIESFDRSQCEPPPPPPPPPVMTLSQSTPLYLCFDEGPSGSVPSALDPVSPLANTISNNNTCEPTQVRDCRTGLAIASILQRPSDLISGQASPTPNCQPGIESVCPSGTTSLITLDTLPDPLTIKPISSTCGTLSCSFPIATPGQNNFEAPFYGWPIWTETEPTCAPIAAEECSDSLLTTPGSVIDNILNPGSSDTDCPPPSEDDEETDDPPTGDDEETTPDDDGPLPEAQAPTVTAIPDPSAIPPPDDICGVGGSVVPPEDDEYFTYELVVETLTDGSHWGPWTVTATPKDAAPEGLEPVEFTGDLGQAYSCGDIPWPYDVPATCQAPGSVWVPPDTEEYSFQRVDAGDGSVSVTMTLGPAFQMLPNLDPAPRTEWHFDPPEPALDCVTVNPPQWVDSPTCPPTLADLVPQDHVVYSDLGPAVDGYQVTATPEAGWSFADGPPSGPVVFSLPDAPGCSDPA